MWAPALPSDRAPGDARVARILAVIALVVALIALATAILSGLLAWGSSLANDPARTSQSTPRPSDPDEGEAATEAVATLPQFTADSAYPRARFSAEIERTLSFWFTDIGSVRCDEPGRLTQGSTIRCTETKDGQSWPLAVHVDDGLGHVTISLPTDDTSSSDHSAVSERPV